MLFLASDESSYITVPDIHAHWGAISILRCGGGRLPLTRCRRGWKSRRFRAPLLHGGSVDAGLWRQEPAWAGLRRRRRTGTQMNLAPRRVRRTCRYPFRAPAVRPSMKYRWKKMKRQAIGMVAIVEAAIAAPHIGAC